MAGRVAATAGRGLGVPVSPGTVLASRTVAGLARVVEARRGEGAVVARIELADRSGDLPVSFAQERVWFVQKLAPDGIAYAAQALLRFRGRLDADVLLRALEHLVRRHEMLRTTFSERNGRPL